MIKRIEISDLRVGMYIHDLNCDWMSHPFLRNRFLLEDESDIRRIADAGIYEIYIDTSRGLDLVHAPTVQEVECQLDSEIRAFATEAPPAAARREAGEEIGRARQVHHEASRIMHSVMNDVRLGRQVQVAQVEPVVERMTGSLLANPGALLSLCRIKDKDDYTFLHSVSVCTLMIAFGRSLGLAGEDLRQGGIGGLLHDLGKMKVPDEVLNKPGRLTDAEFELIKRHPGDGHAVLLETPGIEAVPLDITRHHHERLDGSGYPDRLAGDAISPMARMAAIVDVYDAITADRCYHKGMPAAEALRKMWEWSSAHFDQKLLQAFMRCVGIYPVGSLVRLESGRLGVVTEQNEGSLLTPRLRVFFSTKSNGYIKPELLDLGRKLGHGGGDRIVSAEVPEKWGVDPQRFLLAE